MAKLATEWAPSPPRPEQKPSEPSQVEGPQRDLPPLSEANKRLLGEVVRENPKLVPQFALQLSESNAQQAALVVLASGPVLRVFELHGDGRREIQLLNVQTGEALSAGAESRNALLRRPFPGTMRVFTELGVVHYSEPESRSSIATTPGINQLNLSQPALIPAQYDSEKKEVVLTTPRCPLRELSIRE